MKIRLAKKSDLSGINKLFTEVIKDLKVNKKIDMLWGEVYPFCEFDTDILNNNMYVLENDNKIIGSFSLSDYDDSDYRNIKWTSENKKFFYLNRLVVLPSEQRKGYAKKMMHFIEEYARSNKFYVIRLTVYCENVFAIGLYEKLGFKKVNEGNWKLEDKVFIGYEKTI